MCEPVTMTALGTWMGASAGTAYAAGTAVALTGVAAAGIFLPALAPYILRAFALACVSAAGVWCVAVEIDLGSGVFAAP